MSMVTVRAFPTEEERDNDQRDNAVFLGQTDDPHVLGRLLNSGTEEHRFINYFVDDKPLDDLGRAMTAVGARRRNKPFDMFYDSAGKIVHC
jgi:hypothetical protein